MTCQCLGFGCLHALCILCLSLFLSLVRLFNLNFSSVNLNLKLNFFNLTINYEICMGICLVVRLRYHLPLHVIYFNCCLFTLEFVLAKFSENIFNFRRKRALAFVYTCLHLFTQALGFYFYLKNYLNRRA